MGQNWIELNGAKVMNEIADYITENNMIIFYRRHEGEDDLRDDADEGMTESHLPDPRMYPWAAYIAPPSCACGAGGCACPRRFIPIQALHLLTWDRLKGSSDPRKKGQVVHHRNHDKADSRLKNLAKGSRSAHVRAHNAAKRRFSPRERLHTDGFRHHPHQPARVVSRPEMIGMKVEAQNTLPRPVSMKKRVMLMVNRLAVRWEALSAELAHNDSGRSIPRAAPRAAWNAPNSRRLGLLMPRMEIAAGEAVFVLLNVKHKFDMDAVAVDAGEPRELLEELRKVPAVDVAISRWRSEKRLPLFR
jgi:hypothetical protein